MRTTWGSIWAGFGDRSAPWRVTGGQLGLAVGGSTAPGHRPSVEQVAVVPGAHVLPPPGRRCPWRACLIVSCVPLPGGLECTLDGRQSGSGPSLRWKYCLWALPEPGAACCRTWCPLWLAACTEVPVEAAARGLLTARFSGQECTLDGHQAACLASYRQEHTQQWLTDALARRRCQELCLLRCTRSKQLLNTDL